MIKSPGSGGPVMSEHDLLSLRRWPRFWLLMGVWTALGLIDAGQFYVHLNFFRGRTVYWEEALASGLADWYLWALLSPAIFALGERFPLDQAHWGRRLGLHALFATGFVLLKAALDLPIALAIHGFDTITLPLSVEDRLLPGYEYLWPLYKFYVVVKFYIYLIVYACV